MSRVENTPASYFGGKWEMYGWISEYFPEHHTYVEPFGGMAGILLQKRRSAVEVYNDVNGQLVNFFRACRDHGDELARRLELTPVSYAEWHAAVTQLKIVERLVSAVLSPLAAPNDTAAKLAQQLRDYQVDPGECVELARLFIVKARQSMAGAPGRSWQSSVTHSRRGMASSCSAWLNMPETIRQVGCRLETVQLENRDAAHVLRKYDSPQTLHYVDPPYYPTTCKVGVYSDAGGAEMAQADHARLLRVLRDLQGSVILSGYDCDLYEKWLVRRWGWRKVVHQVPCRSAVTTSGTVAERTTRDEVLWIRLSGHAEQQEAGLFGGLMGG